MKNKTKLFAVLMLGSSLAYGQKPSVAWDRCHGFSTATPVQVWMKDMKPTPDSGYIGVGTASLNAPSSIIPGHHDTGVGGFDGWVFKVDKEGNTQWEKCLGGKGVDETISVVADYDGGYLVGGNTSSVSGDVHNWVEGKKPGYGGYDPTVDAWVLKLKSNGDTLWSKAFGSVGDELLKAVIPTKDGGVIFCGSTDTTEGMAKGWHPGSETSWLGRVRTSDAWIVKLDKNGDTVWTRTIGGSGNESANVILETKEGGFIVSGNAGAANGDIAVNKGGADAWLIKLDAKGNTEWQKTYGGSLNDMGVNVLQLSSGDYMMLASTISGDFDVSANKGGGRTDFWLVKLNDTGKILWEKTYGGTKADAPKTLEVTPDGGFLMAGATQSVDVDITDSHPNGDGWVVRTDDTGKILWSRSMGGNDYEGPSCGAYLRKDGSILGFVEYTTAGGSGDLTCASSMAGWAFRLTACPAYTYLADTICKGASYSFGGKAIATAGVYWDTKMMASGACDSMIRLTLSIETITKPVISSAGTDKLGTGTYAVYQWLKEGIPVPGATAATYTATARGSYRVVVSNPRGCTDTSEVFHFTPLSIKEHSVFEEVYVYPNPAAEQLTISLGVLKDNTTASFATPDGRIVSRIPLNATRQTIDIRNLAPGIYFLKIGNDRETVVTKIIKN